MKFAAKTLKWIIITLFVLVVFILGILTVFEYRPDQTEELEVAGNAGRKARAGEEFSVLTWNMGYGDLGEQADFFMDGGSSVFNYDEDGVRQNVEGMLDFMEETEPDALFLQEIDANSTRSHGIDMTELAAQTFADYDSAFAYNFKVLYVPYPIPPMGHIESGIMTLSSYEMVDAVRESLYCPYSWPVRIANLKRCVLVSRIPVEGSDRELVLVNAHLEAYDDGEGKEKQIEELQALLSGERDKGNYVICGGDFNEEFSTTDLTGYLTASGDQWKPGSLDVGDFDSRFTFHVDSSTPTCRSLDSPLAGADRENFLFYAIDGFIVSDNIEVTSLETQDLGFQYSDHNPVLIRCRLAE